MAAYGYSVVSKMRAYHYSNCIACLFISSLHTAYLVVLQILLCPNTKFFFFFFLKHTMGNLLMLELILEIFQYLYACPFSAGNWQLFWLIICCYLLLGFRKENFMLICLSSISICQAVLYLICSCFTFYISSNRSERSIQ